MAVFIGLATADTSDTLGLGASEDALLENPLLNLIALLNAGVLPGVLSGVFTRDAVALLEHVSQINLENPIIDAISAVDDGIGTPIKSALRIIDTVLRDIDNYTRGYMLPDAEKTLREISRSLHGIVGELPTPRILLVGDSWAEYLFPHFKDALVSCGLPAGLVTGTEPGYETAIAATTAEGWASFNLPKIEKALRRYADVDIVHLSMGGNDVMSRMAIPEGPEPYLQRAHENDDEFQEFGLLAPPRIYSRDELIDWRRRFESGAPQRLIDKTVGHVLQVILYIKNLCARLKRPIKIVVCGYTQIFLNPQTNQIQIDWIKLNAIVLRALIDGLKTMVQCDEDVKFVDNMFPSDYDRDRFRSECGSKCVYGDDPLSYYTTEEFMKDAYFQATKDSLREDGFHLIARGYKYLATKCIKIHYEKWLSRRRATSPKSAPEYAHALMNVGDRSG